jgi:hypothetical protein
LLLTWAIAMPAITDDKKPDTLKKDDDFVPLFNGKDLTGWVNVNSAPSTPRRSGPPREPVACAGLPEYRRVGLVFEAYPTVLPPPYQLCPIFFPIAMYLIEKEKLTPTHRGHPIRHAAMGGMLSPPTASAQAAASRLGGESMAPGQRRPLHD